MIGFVRGRVDYLGKDHCLIEAGGIGYRIFMAAGDLAQLHIEQEVKVFTYLAVREDALLLPTTPTVESARHLNWVWQFR